MNKSNAHSLARDFTRAFVEHQQMPAQGPGADAGAKYAAQVIAMHKALSEYFLTVDTTD